MKKTNPPFGAAALSLALGIMAQPVSGQEPGDDGLIDERDLTRRSVLSADIPRVVPPLIGRLNLNGTSFDLGDKWVFDMGVEEGDARNIGLSGAVTHVLSNEVSTSNASGLLKRKQTAWVLQLSPFTQERTVTATTVQGGDLIGFNLDLSITGSCFIGASTLPSEGSYCTYTPGIATVPGALEPDTLVPTLFSIDTGFGQVIPKETHESLKVLAEGQPVFQRGESVDGGPLVGISLEVPNSGFISTEAGRRFNRGERDETYTTRYVPSFARIEQNLYSNSQSATADRTTRAFVLLDQDDWNRRNALAQLAGLLLPEMNRPLLSDEGQARLGISNNLFYALSNARRPANSFTVFETGAAKVDHPARSPRSAAETPTAYYQGFWLGFSPERDTSATGRVSFVPVGPRLDLTEPKFAEGGGDIGLRLLENSSLAILDTIDQSFQPIDVSGIDDIFVQLGFGLTTQEAVRRITTTETARYRYVPHLSFNGNITSGLSVFRYYTGAILDKETNAYVGADYTYTSENGWSAYARGELYSRPNAEYRNELEGRVSRTMNLGADRSLTLGAGFISVFDDGNSMPLTSGLEDSSDRLEILGRWVEGPFSFSVRHRVTDDGSKGTTLGVGYSQNERLALNAQFTPSSSESAFIEGLAGLSWRVAEPSTAPVLRAQVARAVYNLGEDDFGSKIEATEKRFLLSFQTKF